MPTHSSHWRFMLFNFYETMQGGKKYWLASAKVDRDSKGGFMRFAQTKTIELMYINKLGLQKELDKLCCFGKLKPVKVIARLGKNKCFPLSPHFELFIQFICPCLQVISKRRLKI